MTQKAQIPQIVPGWVLLSAVAVGSLGAATGPARAQCPEPEQRALEAFDRAWSEATRTGDRAALERIFADDYQGVGVAGPAAKAATIDGAVRAAEQNRANPQNLPQTRYDYYLIACTPVSATVTHRNTTTAVADGVERVSYSRSVHVMEKRNGQWRVVSNAGHPLDDAAQLYYLEREWNDAIRNKDVAWIDRHYARDATDISAQTGRLDSKADVLAATRADNDVYEVVETSEMAARVEGNSAIVTGIFYIKGRNERNQPFERRSRYTDVWIKRDGRWQVWASQGTAIQ
jgi:ketosteroid isomerase-like protein